MKTYQTILRTTLPMPVNTSATYQDEINRIRDSVQEFIAHLETNNLDEMFSPGCAALADLIIWAQDQGVPNNEMWAGYHSLNDIRKDADPILLKYLEKGIDEKKLSLLREIPRAIAALGITERFANTSVLTSKILSLLAESKGDDDNLYLTLIPCLCSMMYDIKVDQLPEIFNVLQWTRDSRLIWMLRELSLVGKFVPEIVSAFIRMLRNPEDYHSFIRPFLDDPRLDYRVIYSLLINLKHTRNTKFRYDLNVLANELQEGNRKIAGVSADSIKDILAL